jgi:transposase
MLFYPSMSRPIQTLILTDAQKHELKRVANAATSAQRDILRARIILLKSSGLSQDDVAQKAGVKRSTVGKWCGRFARLGLAGLCDAKGRGRKSSIAPEAQEKIVAGAVKAPPHRSRWSTRSMARHAGVSHETVRRLWRANDIKPHVTRVFKVSNDPHFEQKFWDVVGLYLNPPERALVLCCDEKSQCQALERTQPCLPLGVGHIRTKTHDYIRHGTLTLFAALSYLDGKIHSCTAPRHTNKEWLRFLKQLHRETPKELDLHLILDNYATHKHATVRAWLTKHPRFHLHFTPTSGSWMNLVERFFRDLTADVVRDGSFTSVKALTEAMEGYLADRNLNPRRYVWRQEGAVILEKLRKARLALEQAKTQQGVPSL